MFVVGSVLDILDGARAAGKGKYAVRGVPGLDRRPRRRSGFMLGAVGLVMMRDGYEWASPAFAAIGGSFLVSYTRARAEALGLKGDVGIGSRAERVILLEPGRARPLPRARPAGSRSRSPRSRPGSRSCSECYQFGSSSALPDTLALLLWLLAEQASSSVCPPRSLARSHARWLGGRER